MALDDKPTATWVEPDLQELCDLQRRETPRLEFKETLSLGTDGQKKEIERDVQGLANGGGGHILFGVAEESLSDGSKVASRLVPLRDGTLYEALNNLLDDRGEPRVPFDLHAIEAADGGFYLAVEVFGRRRPHRANDGRYYIRRNLRVRQMTEAEIADAYRERFERDARPFSPRPGEAAAGEPEPGLSQDVVSRLHRGLDPRELVLYQQETGEERTPAWVSVIAYPVPLQDRLLDPVRHETATFRQLGDGEIWREHPLEHFRLRKTVDGFFGQLPDRDDTFPAYLIRLWSDGLLEWGDLPEPVIRRDEPDANRIIPTHAEAEYIHDFLVFAAQVFRFVGYEGELGVRVRFDHVAGYHLAVDRGRFWRPLRPISEDSIEVPPWRGEASELHDASPAIARDALDRLFIAAGAEGGAYFFDSAGDYTPS